MISKTISSIDEIILETLQTQAFTKFYFETPFCKKSYHIETCQLICVANYFYATDSKQILPGKDISAESALKRC